MADKCTDPAFSTNTAPTWVCILNSQREAGVKADIISERNLAAVRANSAGRGPGKKEKSDTTIKIIELYKQGYPRRDIVSILGVDKAKVKGVIGKAVEANLIHAHTIYRKRREE